MCMDIAVFANIGVVCFTLPDVTVLKQHICTSSPQGYPSPVYFNILKKKTTLDFEWWDTDEGVPVWLVRLWSALGDLLYHSYCVQK